MQIEWEHSRLENQLWLKSAEKITSDLRSSQLTTIFNCMDYIASNELRICDR